MRRKISPPLDQLASLRTPLTPGEQRVLDLLDRHLPLEWEIYVQPHLNGLRPDFVLLHPLVGVAVFEVKDSPLSSWERFPRKHPVATVIQYRREIHDLYCPRLELAASAAGLAAVTGGVIMAGMSTAEARRLLETRRDQLGVSGGGQALPPNQRRGRVGECRSECDLPRVGPPVVEGDES